MKVTYCDLCKEAGACGSMKIEMHGKIKNWGEACDWRKSLDLCENCVREIHETGIQAKQKEIKLTLEV
jgi:hypothetical protein